MKTRIRLVYVPGSRLRLESLCPKGDLILLAEELGQEGILAEILDFGSLGHGIEAPSAPPVDSTLNGLMGWASLLRGGKGGFPLSFRTSIYKSPAEQIFYAQALQVLNSAPSLILFLAETPDEYYAIKRISHHLRALAPQAHQSIMGPYAKHFARFALGDCSTLDTVLSQSASSIIALLADHQRDPQTWAAIPGLYYRSRNGMVCASPQQRCCTKEDCPHLSCFPTSFAYECTGKQFPLHVLDKSLFLPSNNSENSTPETDTRLAERLCSALLFLNKRYRARVFHIEASRLSAHALSLFSDIMLSRNLVFIYSLGHMSETVDPPLADRLFASGCRAIGFDVPTGSQRLLEDFYSRTASVSALRSAVRQCRASGIFTVAHLCYPCPLDDYHTRAETELFLEACRPDGIRITLPELKPETSWYRRAHEFGFIINHYAYEQWVGGNSKCSAAPPYKMAHWRSHRMLDEQRSLELFARQLGCITDISEKEGLLARLVKDAMDESMFIEQLRKAIKQHDAVRLAELADIVNLATPRTPMEIFPDDVAVAEA